MRNLKHLNLNLAKNNFGENYESLKFIGEAIEKLDNLETLVIDLRQNKLQDVS